jgi:dTDP-4-dehydrorhamnose 3,5-epimerase
MMNFIETPLKGAFIIEISPLKDHRGFFERMFCKKELSAIGFTKEIVQVNHSYTLKKGTVRGLHFQRPPFAETKIIRCIKGSVFDIAVDIRKESPTFLHWYGVELTEDNNKLYYLPEGFAHGFQTLQANTELLYFHSEYFNHQSEGALNFNDPILKLVLPLQITDMSERDRMHPFIVDPVYELPDFDSPFLIG